MGFQVPRVTINIDFKEGTSFGELSIISLGYGLHQAWIYSSMFDKGGIFGTSGLQAGPFNDQLSLAYFVSILVYGLLLLVASVLDTRLIRPLHATPTLVIAALLGSTGTLLLLAPDGSLLSSEALQLASGVLTGAGSSVLLLAWASPSRAAIQPPSSSTEHSPSPSDSASTVWCCIRSPSRGEAWQARSFPSRKSPCCSCFVAT